jgi:hypothetical protein
MKNLFAKDLNTSKFHIGLPEAEREANFNSRVKLVEVFKDFLEVFPELEEGNFIITGQKGSGKSAIGQILNQNARNNPNEFCEYIQKSDIDLEEVVQFSENTSNVIQKELLFKWIILTRILRMITENQALKELKEVKIIKHFLVKNSGFVNIDKYEIKEILKTTGFEIAIEKLLHFFRFKAKDELLLKGSKAPFYKLIPHLEFIVKSILTSHEDKTQGNSYKIIFDDLDIEFKANKDLHVDTLLNLIRISKHYNNNLFSNNNINAKVIILLRDDIANVLIKKSADMAKVFSSYRTNLKWFDFDLYKRGENLIPLKQFIDNRIENAFKKASINFEGNPWNYLIKDLDKYNESSFKYVVDHTFHTPRDLLLFMYDIHKYKFKIPLDDRDIYELIGNYSIKAKEEIENALSIHYNYNEIEILFSTMNQLSRKNSFSKTEFEIELFKLDKDINSTKALELLFNYSLVGNKNNHGNMVYFKHRQGKEHYYIDYDKEFILHRILLIYFKNKRE